MARPSFDSAAAAEFLRRELGRALEEVRADGSRIHLRVSAAALPAAARLLAGEGSLAFSFLSCLSGVDRADRMEVVYHLFSPTAGGTAVLKVFLPRENPLLPSVISVWPGAGWHERETHDMFGIVFEGHPDLSPLLMPEDSPLHPLRREFDLSGKAKTAEAPAK
jgi:NADH-quinone oxidoreductase subunit C